MPRNNKKVKQRALHLDSADDTVIPNLAANEDNNRTTQMDKLKGLQDMFVNRLDPDLIRDVFHECAANFDKTLECLLELCDSNAIDCVPNSESPLPTIAEVPRTLWEPPLYDSTNCNTRYPFNSTTEDSVNVLNVAPIHPKVAQKSPLNAMMPFANLFSPKVNQAFNISGKTSHLAPKSKDTDLKDEIKQMIQNRRKVLVLMRGLPGSGKTTLANFLVYGSDGIILSTDDYFINNGNYRFDAYQLPIAHEWNQKRAQKYIENGKTPVVIDNTNLEGWEMRPYVSLGYQKDYKIYFIEPDTHWSRNLKELSKRNIHGIPKEKLELMSHKFERLTVEDVVKSLPSSHSLQKSNSDEKVNKISKVSTNGAKQLILRSSSSPSNAFAKTINNDCEELPQLSAQLADMTSTSSPNSTEPTSPVTENQIDIDLLLALNQRNTDSEDCSSVNASEGGSSCGQESGWERDDEFTYTHNEQPFPTPSSSCSTQPLIDNSLSDPKSQSDSKQKNALKNDCLKEESAEDMACEEPWDATNVSDKVNCGASSSHQEMSLSAINKRMFSLVGVPKSNWEFPPFPINDLNNKADKDSEVCLSFYSRSSQTELKDWALLELKQYNKDSNEGLETEDMDGEDQPIETKVNPKNDLKVRLHKGTITTDIPDDLSRDQKLNTLREKFPKAESNHLNEILDACHEDLRWAQKLLSELNDDHFDIGSLEQLSPTGTDRISSPEIDSESTSNSGEEEQLELIVNRKDSEEPEFVLTLDPLLAAQLQSQFGDITDALTDEDLTITLSHGVARLLHHTWKKSLNQKSLNNNTTKPQSINNHNNNNIGNRINKVSKNKKKEFTFEVNTPKSELQEIMDLELAKDLSRREYDDKLKNGANSSCESIREKTKDLFATKLKRDQLYQRYPGVDQNFLDSIFDSNKYCLGKTIDCLDNSLGLDDDFSKETEVLIAQERNGSSNGSPLNGSRSSSPVKAVRKVVDINANISQINDLVVKKKELHDKARLAFQRKMFAVASYYGGEAMKFQSQIDRLGVETVDAILINSTNSNELDLHGLHIPEVNSILSAYFNRKSEELRRSLGKRKLVLDIITGYGATKGVQGRIKPTVIQYLKQKNFTFEMVNMGVIRVTLTQ